MNISRVEKILTDAQGFLSSEPHAFSNNGSPGSHEGCTVDDGGFSPKDLEGVKDREETRKSKMYTSSSVTSLNSKLPYTAASSIGGPGKNSLSVLEALLFLFFVGVV